MDKNTLPTGVCHLIPNVPNVVTISICFVIQISGSFLELNRHVKK